MSDDPTVTQVGTSQAEVNASEGVKAKAAHLGVNLQDVQGTGSGGRVLDRDVEKAAQAKAASGKTEAGQKLVGIDPDYIGEYAHYSGEGESQVRYAFRSGTVTPVSGELFSELPTDSEGNLQHPLVDATNQ